MSDAAADKKDDKESAAATGGGGNKKLLIIVLAVNVLLVGGLGYVFLSGGSNSGKQAHGSAAGEHEAGEDGEDEGGEDGEDGEGHDKAKFGPLIEVGSFVANLATGQGEPPRYAKVTVHVEALNESAKERVEAALVPIKTEALMMFSNAKPDDVIGQDKIMALSDTLLKRANKVIGKKSIKRVYFSELVIQ